MILRQDLAFSSDMLIELFFRFRETDDIHDLNSFVENEPLQTMSFGDLKTRFEKSFNIYIKTLELMLNTYLDRKSLVIIASIAIDIANRESAEIDVGRKQHDTAVDQDKISWVMKITATYNFAVSLFGSKEHLAIRRQLVLLAEKMIKYISFSEEELIESGSYAEGICYPRSDIDHMKCAKSQRIITTVNNDIQSGDLLMVPTSPCYCLLIDMTQNISQKETCIILGLPIYSSTLLKENRRRTNETIHGPCLTIGTIPIDIDVAPCIKCSLWPDIANEWMHRNRCHGWPTPEMIEDIVDNGCHVVPIGDSRSLGNQLNAYLSEEQRSLILSGCSCQRECRVLDEKKIHLNDHEWRLSFSLAERYIMHSLNHTQFLVYNLLRLALKEVIEKSVPGVMCSYFMKTILFFTIETNIQTIWCSDGLEEGYRKCLETLSEAIYSQNCPNYFVRVYNMFRNRISSPDRIMLLRTVEKLKQNGVFGLLCDLEKNDFLSTLTVSGYTEMILDSEGFFIFFRTLEPFLIPFMMFSQSNEISSLETIKAMIIEVNAFRNNQIQDYVITFTATLLCKMLMDRMIRCKTGSEKNNRTREDIEFLLRDLQKGDVSSKALTHASYLYLIGYTRSAVSVLTELVSDYPSYNISDAMSAESKQAYRMTMCNKGFTIGYKFRKSVTPPYSFHVDYLNAAPFPMRLWIAVTESLDIHPLTYAYFLLGLCEVNDNQRSIANLKERLTNAHDRYHNVETKMCLGILESIYGRNEEAFGWFSSVYLMKHRLQDAPNYWLVPLIYIACLLFKLLRKGVEGEIMYKRHAK